MYTINSWKLAVSVSPRWRKLLLIGTEIEDSKAKAKALADAIKEIPKAHRDTLQFLIFHLSRVIEHQDENLVGLSRLITWTALLTRHQMTPLNLAVVFAPTIMRPMDIQRELSDVQQQRVAVQSLLENYKTVFGED
jgi:hypothetical protein